MVFINSPSLNDLQRMEGCLSLADTFYGTMKEDYKKKIRELIEHPNRNNWDRCNGIVINACGRVTTLWQAVCAVDPAFPRVGPKYGDKGVILNDWQRIPDRELILNALEYATH